MEPYGYRAEKDVNDSFKRLDRIQYTNIADTRTDTGRQ